jgi:hypothetical protein
MAGGSEAHNLICGNVLRELGNRFKGRPCYVYTSDMKVRIESGNLSNRHGERSEAGWPPVGVERGRAAVVAKGPRGPAAAKAVCKRLRDAVKPSRAGAMARRGVTPTGRAPCRCRGAGAGRTGAPRLSPSGRRKGDWDVPFRILSTATLRASLRWPRPRPRSGPGLGSDAVSGCRRRVLQSSCIPTPKDCRRS